MCVCVCVCLRRRGAHLIDSLEPECSLCRVSNSPIMPTRSLSSFVSFKGSSPTLSLLHNLPLFADVLVQTLFCIGIKINAFFLARQGIFFFFFFVFAMHVN